ncbi:uncharacterized protein AB675_8688 [Cyphellophora attinorum]|uniref:Uncharacterized protein n=1 Tax=Cyphellophora attinorum TaxID=1664694 RepID=A0A0N1H9F4_9EURO|nr:uncharacterized protein AB675_8688 [Phialophora attinorum]KPI44206.1 hypothetical protein AB675_8688 [Phialophora attinorum]
MASVKHDPRSPLFDPVQTKKHPPGSCNQNSSTIKHTSPSIESVFSRFSISGHSYQWSELHPSLRLFFHDPPDPTDTDNWLSRAWRKVVYDGPGDRGQAPSKVMPLGHLVVNSPHCCSDYYNASSAAIDELCGRDIPTWFSMVVEVGNPDMPVWMMRDLASVNWQLKADKNKPHGRPQEQVTLLEEDKDRAYVDKATLERYSLRPRYESRMPELAEVLSKAGGGVDSSEVDLVRLFARLSDWDFGANNPTHLDVYTRTSPRLCNPTTRQLQETKTKYRQLMGTWSAHKSED